MSFQCGACTCTDVEAINTHLDVNDNNTVNKSIKSQANGSTAGMSQRYMAGLCQAEI